MADAIRDLRNLPLFELIGAPLVALVEAEVQAARATVEFLTQVGFEPVPGPTPKRPGAAAPPAADPDGLGRLRMASFEYSKRDETGTVVPFRVEIPVLALVPIPGVRIKAARVAFTARITDVEEQPATNPHGRAAGRAGDRPSFLKSSMTTLRGGLAPAPSRREDPSTGARQVRGSYEIDIQVELESLPITPGLETILNLLDQAVRDDRAD